MKIESSYPYVTDDNLEHIQSYQYSSWLGDAFIVAFYQQRQTLLQSLPKARWLVLEREISNTSDSLWPLVVKMRQNQFLNHKELDWLLVLLKKFEVSKRLFAAYQSSPPYRQCDEYYGAPEPYMLLAELALRQWLVQHNSYWLSGALKLIDTLCSIVNSCDTVHQSGIAALILLEQQLITSLLEVVSEPH
ncbi:hypothetical protein [Aeromonas veronii]|uniref:hypothetical protein n=1 Tax=Aeromonas veronii TaxID=654 RepID=UPI00111771D0|nr:hypothetical protein [Aeromonas veronii]